MRGLWPMDFLVIEATATQVRAAHYSLWPPQLQGSPGTPSEDVFRVLVEVGYVHPKSKREAWRRQAHGAHSLGEALRWVLEHSAHEWRTVEAYIRATAWGERLP